MANPISDIQKGAPLSPKGRDDEMEYVLIDLNAAMREKNGPVQRADSLAWSILVPTATAVAQYLTGSKLVALAAYGVLSVVPLLKA